MGARGTPDPASVPPRPGSPSGRRGFRPQGPRRSGLSEAAHCGIFQQGVSRFSSIFRGVRTPRSVRLVDSDFELGRGWRGWNAGSSESGIQGAGFAVEAPVAEAIADDSGPHPHASPMGHLLQQAALLVLCENQGMLGHRCFPLRPPDGARGVPAGMGAATGGDVRCSGQSQAGGRIY